jgi:hypothetical protein
MKTITFILVVAFANNLFAEPPVHKYRQRPGIFGFKTVTQTSDPLAIVLNCIDPGLISCRVKHGITIVGDDGEISLSEQDILDIESSIDRLIDEGKDSGTIIRGQNIVITYWFKENTDELSYTLYSRPQAIRYNIINQ